MSDPDVNLNLGCGTTRFPGYLGIDIFRADNVDVLAHGEQLPFKDATFEHVLADSVLEHFEGLGLDRAMREIARVLKPGGTLLARVPHGLRGLLNPHHFHAFKRSTFRAWTTESEDFGGTTLQNSRLFRIERSYVTSGRGIPLWHFKKYFPRLFRLISSNDIPPRPMFPLLRWPTELTVILRRLPPLT